MTDEATVPSGGPTRAAEPASGGESSGGARERSGPPGGRGRSEGPRRSGPEGRVQGRVVPGLLPWLAQPVRVVHRYD